MRRPGSHRCTGAMTTTTSDPTSVAGTDLALHPTMNGPRNKANGGFAAGTFAALVGGTATVNLHRPIPLGRAFGVAWSSPGIRRDGRRQDRRNGAADRRFRARSAGPAELCPGRGRSETPTPTGGVRHTLSDCVVCGPDRTGGLRVHPGPARPGRSGVLAAPYDPPAWFSVDGHATHASVWGALDCVSYPAAALADGRLALLASLTAHRTREIAVGELARLRRLDARLRHPVAPDRLRRARRGRGGRRVRSRGLGRAQAPTPRPAGRTLALTSIAHLHPVHPSRREPPRGQLVERPGWRFYRDG